MTIDISAANARLLADEKMLARLNELRGWTPEALRHLAIGFDHGRIVIPVTTLAGTVAGVLRYQPNPERRDDGMPKLMAAPGTPRELFPPPETLPADESTAWWIVEGEPDAIAAHSVGLPATGVPGANGWKTEWAVRFEDRDVIVCCDCDPPGRSAATRIADDLTGHARSIRVLDLEPSRDDGHDLGDLVVEGREHPDRIRDLLTRAADNTPLHTLEQDRPPSPRLTAGQWGKAILDHIEGRKKTPAWPLPFTALNEAMDGGIRPGELWVLAGWTSQGKSVFADQIADSVTKAGASCHLYLTEMTVVQRGLRLLARRTGTSMRDLRRVTLTPEQLDRCRAELDALPYSATVVTGWTPAQVAADIRVHGTNLAIIDLLHGFDYQDEREISRIVSEFAGAATSDVGGRGSAVLVVSQLNDGQMRDARSPARPKPGMHSLKGASWIKQRPQGVIFTWLKDDADGNRTMDGAIWIAKQQNGDLAGVEVTLDPERLRFVERDVADRPVSWNEHAERGAA